MDTTDPEIVFDENGICNHCRAYDERAGQELLPLPERQRKLELIVEELKQKGKHKDYDCVIGVSGGVDSTMAAYLVRKLGLRALAVHVDNGWNDELAVYNIEQCCKRLCIDLYTYVIDWEEFRDLQLSFFKASVANIEVLTDQAIMAVLFKTAADRGIRYVISGGNIVTEAIMPDSWMYDPRDWRHIRGIQNKFGRRPIRTFPKCSLIDYAYYLLAHRIKYVALLNYIDYVKSEAKKTIQDELGWRDYGGKHYESIFTRFFQAYILPTKFSMDKRKPHLSTLICSGQISREDALKELERELYPQDLFTQDYEYFLKKMGLSEAEFSQIMQEPVKTYRDYPSNSFFFVRFAFLIGWVKWLVRPSSLK